MHFALLSVCVCCVAGCLQARVDETYKNPASWDKMSIMMTAGSGKFSTDRTISEYAADIWGVKPCAVPQPEN